jgi:hypothetical protein
LHKFDGNAWVVESDGYVVWTSGRLPEEINGNQYRMRSSILVILMAIDESGRSAISPPKTPSHTGETRIKI